ncbi:MAG TPA: response regulator [Alphaproteobacteria bacterium]
MQQQDNPKYSILVVDDNPPFRHLVAAWLYQAGYHVVQANDGLDALEQLNRHKVDLILLDLQMEPLGGFNFREAVGATSYNTIPTILITSDPSSDILMRASRMGFDGVMKKPIEQNRLMQMIAQQLDRLKRA